MRYNAVLAITGAIRVSSREKNYQELGLESLQQRQWYRKLCYFFKLIKNNYPKYLFNNIPQLEVHKEQETLTIFLNLMLSILLKIQKNCILNTTIEDIASSKRFEVPHFDSSWHSYVTALFTSYYFYSFFFSFFKFSYFHCTISHYRWLSMYTFLSCNIWIWFLV